MNITTKNILILTTVAYFSGLTNIFFLEIVSYSILLLFILKNTKKYWLTIEGLFIILFSIIIFIFTVSEPILLINHFKQLLLTLSLIITCYNLKPLSTGLLSIISLINFIFVFLQLKLNIIWLPKVFLSGIDDINVLELGYLIRPIGILAGAHQSTFLIALITLALFYANQSSLISLLKGKFSKKNIFLAFIIFLNCLSILYSFSLTALISLLFQFSVIVFSGFKITKKFFKSISIFFVKIKSTRINIILLGSIIVLLIIFTFYLDQIISFTLYLASIIFDNRSIGSLEIITSQFLDYFNLLSNLSLFPSYEINVETKLGEISSKLFFNSTDNQYIGVEIGYFKLLHTHGIIIGIYLLSFLFRKLYGIRSYMFLSYLHYGHLTTNPVLLVFAITASNYARINKEKRELNNNYSK